MVGASLAAAIEQLGYSCLLVDNAATSFDLNQASPDMRVSSLSLASVEWLKNQNIWSRLEHNRLRYYDSLSVRDATGGQCQFNAATIKRDYLGCFVENQHLAQAAQQHPGVAKIQGQISEPRQTPTGWQLSVDDKMITCDFLVSAEGARSPLRKNLGFSGFASDYAQACYCALVKLDKPAPAQTWQVFTTQGAHALLPLYDSYATFILYREQPKIRQLMAQDTSAQTDELSALFSSGVGNFEFIQSASFALQKYQIHQPLKNRCLVLGDAAHQIHPLAGQGVNLGFRDAAAFVDLLEKQGIEGLAKPHIQRKYNIQRRIDSQGMSATMDLIYHTAAPQWSFMAPIRKLALNGINHSSVLQSLILNFATGTVQR